jgi:predicted NBD/HSP70 family sugar kinase
MRDRSPASSLGELWFGDGAALGDDVHISGEVGHTTLEPDGAPCTCGGRGCLELFCGQEAILRAAGLDPGALLSAPARG